MTGSFLATYLRFTKNVTRAARAMAVDTQLNVVDAINLEQADLEDSKLGDLAADCLTRAIENGEAVITNNVITDPSQAPVTNTNFSDLRVVVAFPVAGHGAIYLDQHIRHGIIGKDVIDKLMRFAVKLDAEGHDDEDENELASLYKQFN